MALTAGEVAHLKAKYQNFVVELVGFPHITWTWSAISAGTITWKPFCLLSPRFAYTSGGDVTIYGGDSYVRPTTAVDTVTFSKASGTGTVTDNGDKTCTVSGASGVVKVEAVATVTATGQTATSYAYVYGGASGNVKAIVARVDGFSGSLETGEWQADIVLRGDYSAVFSSYDGRDFPVLMHATHYWDGASDTFGGYKRDNNTFVLMCRDSTIHVKHSGEYETILHMETPAYVLKQTLMFNEAKFSTDAGGEYVVTDLTPTDVAYYLVREISNYHQYFNVSIWNNSSVMDNIHVRPNDNLWNYCKDAVARNFGIAYFNRWGNLNIKPDPRIRYDEWAAIAGYVYDSTNPLTQAHMLEYELTRRRIDQAARVSMQAVLPDLTIVENYTSVGALGDTVEFTGLMAEESSIVQDWANQMKNSINTPYEIECRLAMGHELNPGDLFTIEEFNPPIGETISGASDWICDDVGYEFDFTRGFWTRRIHATMLNPYVPV